MSADPTLPKAEPLNAVQMLLLRSSAMKGWIEALSQIDDPESNMNEFAHHGSDDDLGGLAAYSRFNP